MAPRVPLRIPVLWAAVLGLSSFGACAGVVFSNLYSFAGNDGAYPLGVLAQGSDGYFYGTTEGGGTNNAGTVFNLSPNGVLTSLYSFTGGNDGASPEAGLVQSSDGYFYGTTYHGGATNFGTVYKISTNGALTSFYPFDYTNGAFPLGELIQGSDGNLYGSTSAGGTSGGGTLLRINTNGTPTTLYSFTGGNDGASPYAGLVQGKDGNFYGTTFEGGTNNAGTMFRISTNGALTSLYSFTRGNDGAWPQAGLVQGSDGSFYGTASVGGTNSYGTVFRISTNGVLTSLYSFTGGNDGANPETGLVQAKDGNFYGTTRHGGTNGAGTVFKVSSNGALSSLYSFTGGNDGASPQAGLVQGSDGNLYGTTFQGGSGGNGTVFRLILLAPPAPTLQAVTLTNRTLNLTWITEAGAMYQVQYKSDLKSTNWTNLRGVVTATGATLSATDSVTNGPLRFYRVVLLP